MKTFLPRQILLWGMIALSTMMVHGSIGAQQDVKEEKGKVTLSAVEEKKQEDLAENILPPEPPKDPIVYDGLTKSELVAKIERSLNSTIKGMGEVFVSHALEVGVDPYVALAIVLEETGCTWECSTLVQECNNIGGQVGSPSCGNGPYRSYPTLQDGIIGFLDNLSYNYYQQGLNTPELINTKYASSKTWASKVNRYVEKIRAA